MDGVLSLIVAFGFYGALVTGLGWVAVRARRRGVGSSVLGAVDEIFHPAAYEPRIQVEVQAERTDPIPAPGEPESHMTAEIPRR